MCDFIGKTCVCVFFWQVKKTLSISIVSLKKKKKKTEINEEREDFELK